MMLTLKWWVLRLACIWGVILFSWALPLKCNDANTNTQTHFGQAIQMVSNIAILIVPNLQNRVRMVQSSSLSNKWSTTEASNLSQSQQQRAGFMDIFVILLQQSNVCLCWSYTLRPTIRQGILSPKFTKTKGMDQLFFPGHPTVCPKSRSPGRSNCSVKKPEKPAKSSSFCEASETSQQTIQRQFVCQHSIHQRLP